MRSYNFFHASHSVFLVYCDDDIVLPFLTRLLNSFRFTQRILLLRRISFAQIINEIVFTLCDPHIPRVVGVKSNRVSVVGHRVTVGRAAEPHHLANVVRLCRC